jgi:type IV pilus assembly protein PilN
MIRINLLPIRQTRKIEAVRRELYVAGALGFVIVLGCFAVWGLAQFRLSMVETDNSRLQAEITRLDEDVKKVDEMEKFKAELEKKLEVIADLRRKKTGPVHMMEEIANATPDKLQLTDLSEKDGAMKIAGISVSNEVISQFLRALDLSIYFEAVYLQDIESEKEKNASVPLKKFSLTARLVSPSKKKEERKDVPEVDAGQAPAAPAEPGAADPAGTPAPADAPATTNAPAPAGATP